MVPATMRPKHRKYEAGLAALGLLWTSATLARGQEAVPPPSTALAPSGAPAFAVLLLSNGRLLQGHVTEDAAGDAYELHMKGGSVPVPKKDVARRFGSLLELYEYRVAHLPERDPDERMKLALWCLEQHLDPQAREQLRAVLAINPADGRAPRMLANLDANALRAAGRDPEVRTTSAEVVETAPRAMNPRAVPRPRPAIGGPAIFGLPPAVAARRFTEFAWYIHPVLQSACASCHNEDYPGDFRLIVGRSRRDWTPDVLRANLDATLRYVDRDDPSRSDLIAFVAEPHGPNDRPIFHGANDVRYRRLAQWLGSLKPSAEPVAKAGQVDPPRPASPGASADTEGFGADRLPAPPRATPTPAPTPFAGASNRSMVEFYQGQATAPGVPPGVKFDLPALPGAPTPPPVASRLPDLPPGTPVPPPDDVIPPTKRAKKKIKLDPALLEKTLKTRQAAPSPPPGN